MSTKGPLSETNTNDIKERCLCVFPICFTSFLYLLALRTCLPQGPTCLLAFLISCFLNLPPNFVFVICFLDLLQFHVVS